MSAKASGQKSHTNKEIFAIGLMLLYCFFVGYTAVSIFRWVEVRRLTHPTYPDFSEFGVATLLGFPLMFVQRMSQRLMLPVARMVIVKKDKWSNNVYESKLTRFGSAVFKIIFFTSFSTYAYMYTLAEANWMPRELFGTGSTSNCWGVGNAGDTQEPIGIATKRFYQVALAYHMSELAFQVVYERSKPDFVEMFTHHVTTCFLLFGSFFGNFVRIGALVLFVHYVSDIPGYGAKMFVDTRCKITTFMFLLGILASWGYLRLYVFPVIIIRSVVEESVLERATMGDLAYYTFCSALSCLVCLHIYWYFLLLRMGYGYIFTGETKDMQANLSSLDVRNAPKPQKDE